MSGEEGLETCEHASIGCGRHHGSSLRRSERNASQVPGRRTTRVLCPAPPPRPPDAPYSVGDFSLAFELLVIYDEKPENYDVASVGGGYHRSRLRGDVGEGL